MTRQAYWHIGKRVEYGEGAVAEVAYFDEQYAVLKLLERTEPTYILAYAETVNSEQLVWVEEEVKTRSGAIEYFSITVAISKLILERFSAKPL